MKINHCADMLTQTLRIGAVLEPSLNSLSHFHAREKTVHSVIALFTFLWRKLKRPVRVLIRLLISELMKKQSIQGLFFY